MNHMSCDIYVEINASRVHLDINPLPRYVRIGLLIHTSIHFHLATYLAGGSTAF